MPRRNKTLTPEMLLKKMSKSMAYMHKLNFLENYAIFMGKVQIIEFALKKILSVRCRYSETKLEKMTLGAAIAELEKSGILKEFVLLLRQLNEFRIDMAHDFLAGHLSLVALDRRFGRLSCKPLRYALAKVEETIHVYDFLNQSKYLFKRQSKVY
jgi:hypothetical protein